MKDELRELLYKHTDKVDKWNDAIFTRSFDDLVDELGALFAKRIVSRTFKEKIKKDIKELEQRYKDAFNNSEMAYTDDNWSSVLTTIKGEIKALHRALNYC